MTNVRMRMGPHLPWWVPLGYVPEDWHHVAFMTQDYSQASDIVMVVDRVLMKSYGRKAGKWKWSRRYAWPVILHDPELKPKILAAVMAHYEPTEEGAYDTWPAKQ